MDVSPFARKECEQPIVPQTEHHELLWSLLTSTVNKNIEQLVKQDVMCQYKHRTKPMSLIYFQKTESWSGLGHAGLSNQHFLVASSVPTEYRLLLERYPIRLQRLPFSQSRFSTTPPVQLVKSKFCAIPLTFQASFLLDHQALDFLLLYGKVSEVH